MAVFSLSKRDVGPICLIAAVGDSAVSLVTVPQKGSVWSLSLLFCGSARRLRECICVPAGSSPHTLLLPNSLFLLLCFSPALPYFPFLCGLCFILDDFFRSTFQFMNFLISYIKCAVKLIQILASVVTIFNSVSSVFF